MWILGRMTVATPADAQYTRAHYKLRKFPNPGFSLPQQPHDGFWGTGGASQPLLRFGRAQELYTLEWVHGGHRELAGQAHGIVFFIPSDFSATRKVSWRFQTISYFSLFFLKFQKINPRFQILRQL